MKRLWLAVILLALIVGVCIGGLVYLDQQTEYLIGQLDRMETALRHGDLTTAAARLQTYLDEYEERTRLFPAYMRHQDLEDNRQINAVLPVILENGQTEELHENIRRLRQRLQLIRDAEMPLLYNIF